MKLKLRYSFLILIVATLLFIWGHSCMPPTVSGNESDAVKEFVEKIIGTDTKVAVFTLRYIRKLAHFTEFAVLAFELTIFTYICTPRCYLDLLRCVCFGPIAAVIDETIQAFVGRGSSFFDVMIDTSGYLFSFLFTSFFYGIIYFFVNAIIKRRNKNNV